MAAICSRIDDILDPPWQGCEFVRQKSVIRTYIACQTGRDDPVAAYAKLSPVKGVICANDLTQLTLVYSPETELGDY